MIFEEAKRGYANLWAQARINADAQAEVESMANKILHNRPRYDAVASIAGCPWWVVGCIHNLEASLNFSRHLHNGDPLTERTVHVPAGRPRGGEPPFSWEMSAVDALNMPPHSFQSIQGWTIPRALFEMEKYNGFGYTKQGINSPYLWSKTTLYDSGKYVADGEFDEDAVSEQIGAAAVMLALQSMGYIPRPVSA